MKIGHNETPPFGLAGVEKQSFRFKALRTALASVVSVYGFVDMSSTNAEFISLTGIYQLAETAAQNDRDILPNGPESLGQSSTGKIRHGHIRDDQIEDVRCIAKSPQCFETTRLGSHFVSKPFQHFLAKINQSLLVIYE